MLHKNVLLKRFCASLIDYCIILIYAIALYFISSLFSSAFKFESGYNPIMGQFIGIVTLTIPVIMYSYLSEKSCFRGTIGKKSQGLIVLTESSKLNKNILTRNILKYMPWEFAHTGVHWTIYYDSKNMEVPIWTWCFLILPQIIVIVYLISIIVTKGKGSVYDRISRTKIAFQD